MADHCVIEVIQHTDENKKLSMQHFADIPKYVLLFMLFMASSYFTSFFPKHTAQLIIDQPIAKHIIGYSILVTSISSVKNDIKTLHILCIAFVSYLWCYMVSREGPISFSISILLLALSYLVNRERTENIKFSKLYTNLYYFMIFANIGVLVSSLYIEY